MKVQQFIKIIEEIYNNKSGFIGICGLSGSGKTTLAQKLYDTFSDRALVISFDDFCIIPTHERKAYLSKALQDEDIQQLTYLAQPQNNQENPYANPLTWYDWDAIAKALSDLSLGKKVTRKNAWNQITGKCDKAVTYNVPNHLYPLYFLDCIYMHQPEITDFIDITTMINTSKKVAYERELARDSHRNYKTYMNYKKSITDLYCIPYLEKHKEQINYFIEVDL